MSTCQLGYAYLSVCVSVYQSILYTHMRVKKSEDKTLKLLLFIFNENALDFSTQFSMIINL